MPHESISVFDMFKIGVGPSSSHTLGPWRAALKLLEGFKAHNQLNTVSNITVLLYGSLAKTGKGHGTDTAILLGLMGKDPVSIEIDSISNTIQTIQQSNKLSLNNTHTIDFNPSVQIQFLTSESLPFHPNALSFLVNFNTGISICETFYSIGGGFIVQEHEINQKKSQIDLPFPINTAADLLHWCMQGLSISEVVLENESAWRQESQTKNGVLNIWHTMLDCIYRGCHTHKENYLVVYK